MTSILVFALLLAQQATAPENSKLSGTVVDSTTGQPLDRVFVVAERRHSDEPGASTSTDSHGVFELVDLDPGDYLLSVKRNGYLDGHYGDRRASDSDGSTITLTAGQVVEGIRAKLIPFGVIGGTVRDSEGEPVAGASVQVYVSQYRGRRREIGGFEGTTTDDLGHYRIAKLPAGRYYVTAEPDSDNEPPPTVDHSANPANAPGSSVTTFYPSTADPSAAAAVELAPGTRNTGVDITLVSGRLHRLIVHIPTQSGLSASADVRYTEEGFGRVGHSRNIDKQTVEISALPEGTYVLHYGAYLPGNSQPGVFDVTADRNGCETTVPVSIGKEEVQELNVTVTACAEVTGHLVLERGVTIKPSTGFPYAIIVDGKSSESHFMKDDGTFRMTLAPGLHTLDFREVSEENGLYVRSLRSADQEFLRSGIALSGGEHLDVQVILASDGGSIEGIVSDSDGKPIPGAATVLIPNDAALRTRLDYTRTAATNQDGHFEIKSAAPGDYKLFAFGDIEKDSWLDPDVLRDFEAKGTAVSVTAKDPNAQNNPGQTVNLTLIP